MLDSPRSFILITASIVVAITLVVLGTKAFKGEQKKTTDLNPVINKEEAKTEIPAKTTTTSKTTVAPKPSTSNTVTPNTKTDYTINYYSSGFSPSNLTIKTGQSVRFINQAGASMYVMATPSGSGFSEFDQGKSVGKGGYYDFTFNRKGTFIYYNNNKKTDTAAITVE
ncbi:MAG: hypothetical protein AAB513_02795 [Patescibacteria group bacterium]